MSEELYGVFFDDSGGTYLTEIYVNYEDAEEGAIQADEAAFEKAVDDADETGEDVADDEYEGMHYVDPVSQELADSASDQLARGFAVQVI
jgi:hypothetical protein